MDVFDYIVICAGPAGCAVAARRADRVGAPRVALVDPQLRMRGVEALRVADASIMPTLIGGNTQAPSAMIGEKAANLIIGQWP